MPLGKGHRLNGVVRALEETPAAFTTFSSPGIENAVNLSFTKYDGVVYELEHNPYDIKDLQLSMQFMLHRQQIHDAPTVAPAVAPMVRIPPNGGENAQWFAKQVLDLGAYGVVWPQITTAQDAYNAVAACRYPAQKNTPWYEPRGIRGDAATNAARYWGLSREEYYQRCDVWPLNPDGELVVVTMCESMEALGNLKEVLAEVPGIGVVLVGEADLTHDMGIPQQYDNQEFKDALREIAEICKNAGVVPGHPHVFKQNVGDLLDLGYRFLMTRPAWTYEGLDEGHRLTGRA